MSWKMDTAFRVVAKKDRDRPAKTEGKVEKMIAMAAFPMEYKTRNNEPTT